VKTTALKDTGGTAHAAVDAAITSNDTGIATTVDKSSDDTAAISLALRYVAENLCNPDSYNGRRRVGNHH
jgi:hypothetical protein